MIQQWLENSVMDGSELLDWYLDSDTEVDGLFIWLCAVLSHFHLNIVHQNAAWTTRASDVPNFLDVVIIFAEGCYLVAKNTELLQPKKAEDDLEDPLDMHGVVMETPIVLKNPIRDLSSHCSDVDVTPRGVAKLVHHFLAELFCMQPTQYCASLVSWIHKYSVHLDYAHDWCAAWGLSLLDYTSHLNRDGHADGLEILLALTALNVNINIITEDHIWSTFHSGVDLWDPTIAWTGASRLVCFYSSRDGIDPDLDTWVTQ